MKPGCMFGKSHSWFLTLFRIVLSCLSFSSQLDIFFENETERTKEKNTTMEMEVVLFNDVKSGEYEFIKG